MDGQVLRRLGLADFSPEQIRFLTYGRVARHHGDARHFGFKPRYSTIEGFDDFVAQQGLRGPLSRDT